MWSENRKRTLFKRKPKSHKIVLFYLNDHKIYYKSQKLVKLVRNTFLIPTLTWSENGHKEAIAPKHTINTKIVRK